MPNHALPQQLSFNNAPLLPEEPVAGIGEMIIGVRENLVVLPLFLGSYLALHETPRVLLCPGDEPGVDVEIVYDEGGNAGLFSTARSVLNLLSLFETGGVVNGVQLLAPDQVRMMSTCFTEGLGLRRSIGFYMHDDDAPSGPLFSRNSFGHTGFTGTSIWLEPEKRLTVVTLTNRVHLGRDQTEDKTKEFRKKLHSAVYQNWG